MGELEVRFTLCALTVAFLFYASFKQDTEPWKAAILALIIGVICAAWMFFTLGMFS